MKKYVINGTALCGPITGIPRYMYEVLTRLDELIRDDDNISLTVCYPDNLKFVDYPFKAIRIMPMNREGKKWVKGVLLPFANQTNSVFCDMSDGYCMQKGGIIKIDDVRPVTQHFDPFMTRMKFRYKLWLARRNASVVITVSDSQKKQLRKFLPKTRIELFFNGYSQLERFKSDQGIFLKFPKIKKGQYYYTLGSLAKHKNFKWIYEVARRNPDKQFVVAGNQDLKKWGTDSSSIINKNVIYVGYVSDDENKALYEECKVFLHPSLYEGFGMPLLESVSLGKDILVSDIPEFREVYGDYVSYLDPYNYDIDLDNVKHIPDNVRASILNKYSWDVTAKQWLDLFKEL